MNISEIKEKIIEGNKLALRRLIEKKKKEDSYIVVSEKGKVVKLKAKNIRL